MDLRIVRNTLAAAVLTTASAMSAQAEDGRVCLPRSMFINYVELTTDFDTLREDIMLSGTWGDRIFGLWLFADGTWINYEQTGVQNDEVWLCLVAEGTQYTSR